MWSFARYDLHLCESEFWQLTYREYDYLVRRHRRAEERQQMLTGILASITANFSMCPPKQPLKPSDFLPTKRHKPDNNPALVAEQLARDLAGFASQR